MQYKLFLFLAVAYTVQALTYENKEDLSYALSLGSMEHYLRNGHLEVKECYPKIKSQYEGVITGFEKELSNLMSKYATQDEKNVIKRIHKITQDLKTYKEKLSGLLKKVDFANALGIAAQVDKVREGIKKDHDQHKKNIEEPKEWNKQKFVALEKSLRPVREKYVDEANKVLETLAECMKTPRCD